MPPARGRVVEICVRGDNNRVFASHFSNHPLDPDLTLMNFGSALIDAQPDLLGTGKSNVTGPRVIHDDIANLRP